jgi:hypothetical protein
MHFFFVKDYRKKYRYFSTEPFRNVQIQFSRWKKIWEEARQKLLLLPQRILVQEQAFEQVLHSKTESLEIFYSGHCDQQKIKHHFFFYLQRQRTRHIFFLIGETLLLPISGLAALLPGPNVFFGVLALLMITHWQALRGINCLLKKSYDFQSSPLLREWEQTIDSKSSEEFIPVLKRIEEEYGIKNIEKILWK